MIFNEFILDLNTYLHSYHIRSPFLICLICRIQLTNILHFSLKLLEPLNPVDVIVEPISANDNLLQIGIGYLCLYYSNHIQHLTINVLHQAIVLDTDHFHSRNHDGCIKIRILSKPLSSTASKEFAITFLTIFSLEPIDHLGLGNLAKNSC